MKLGSYFVSRGLLISDTGARGLGRVGSTPAGYVRGPGHSLVERCELDDTIEGAMSLLLVYVEKVDASESLDRNDQFDDDVDEEFELIIENVEVVEFRAAICKAVRECI